MDVTTKSLHHCDLITVIGRIDQSTAPMLTQALTEVKKAGRYKIVLNLKNVTYISSAGLSELIDTQKTCKYLKRGELLLAEIQPRIREILETAGLTPLFKIFETELEAVDYF